MNRTYDTAGYGVLTNVEKATVKKLAITKGILVDPVYTGRAFYGMLHTLKEKKRKEITS